MLGEYAFRCAALVIPFILFTAGCSTTQKLYSDESLTRNQVARIRTISKEKSGKITRRVKVESINNSEIDCKKYKWIAVLPGKHNMSVSFYKRIGPSGLNIPIKLDLFGMERDLIKPKPSEIITSTVNQFLVVNVQAGKSYHFSAKEDLRIIDISPNASSWEQLLYKDRVAGSCTCKLVEE